MCKTAMDENLVRLIGVFICCMYLIAGIVMMGFGISIKATPDNFLSMYTHQSLDIRIAADGIMQSSASFMVAVAVLSILSGFYGVYVFIFKEKSLLKAFCVILVVLIVLNLILIIYTACYPSKGLMQENMKKTMISNFMLQDIKVDNNSDVVSLPPDENGHAWAYTQLKTDCCGINGPEDYKLLPLDQKKENITWLGLYNLTVPLSCCSLKSSVDVPLHITNLSECINSYNMTAVNQKGCYSSLMIFYAYSAVAVYRLAPILILFQTLLLLLSIKYIYDMSSYYRME